MKQLYVTIILALFLTPTAFAQLPDNSVAPDFTVKDLNGNSYNLYSILNSGKTVILDVMTTWCGPCWTYHRSGDLEQLYKHHGPLGAPGVDATTTDDVMVFMIEAERSNTRAQLYGITGASGGYYSVTTAGDWVTGTPYPIIDSNAVWTNGFNYNWQISAYPTIYMICRDHLVRRIPLYPNPSLYSLASASCPSYAPSVTLDAKLLSYAGDATFLCSATPQIKFQNYSTTQSITAATIKVYSGTNQVSSYAWSGNLPPYGVAVFSMPAFAPAQYLPFRHEVLVSGDTYAANNSGSDSLYKVYSAANATSLPWTENFESSFRTFPERFFILSNNWPFTLDDSLHGSLKGADGMSTRALSINTGLAGRESILTLGNFAFNGTQAFAFEADYSYGQWRASDSQKLDIQVSKDCGITWSTVWSKSGAALATRPFGAGPYYRPVSAGEWQHMTIPLDAYASSNTFIRIRTTYADSYTDIWMDNLKITTPTGVAKSLPAGGFTIFPNPARESATIETVLRKGSNVMVKIVDATGRTVVVAADGALSPGMQRIRIPLAGLAAGIYQVVMQIDDLAYIERLSVIK